MKHFNLKALMLCLLTVVAITTSAQPVGNNASIMGKAVAKENSALSKGAGGLSRTNVKRKAIGQSTLFSVATVEGIDMYFSIVSEEEKTCVVGGPVPDQEGYYYYGVKLNTTGIVTIPEMANGYKVIGIEPIAFFDHTGITEVIIPEGVESIGSEAFNGCIGLTSMTIPNSVKSIGEYAFFGCSGLTSVTIGSGVTSIGDYAFRYCTGLTSVTIGSGVTSIGSSAFSDCSELTSVTIGSGVTSIGSSAFSDCSGLTSVTIPNNVTNIGGNAFSGCTNLKKVIVPDLSAWASIKFTSYSSNPLYYSNHLYSDENTEITDLIIPNNVTSIGDNAFYCCYGLTSVTIPNSVTSIGSSAFRHCSGLTSVTIGSGVKEISIYAFQDCLKLKNVDLGNGLDTIAEYAFFRCKGLEHITIPNSVRRIYNDAFSGTNLSTVTINSNFVTNQSFDKSSFSKYTFPTIFGSQVKKYVLGDSVKAISSYAFYECSNLTDITIPYSINSISEKAFVGCDKLINVTINSNILLSRDDPYAYENTNRLSYIFGPQVETYLLGDSITKIGNYVFDGCTSLKSITIPHNVNTIGEYAFWNCPALSYVIVKSNQLTSKDYTSNINFSTIFGSQVKSFFIGDDIMNLGNSIFEGCSSLNDIILPTGLKTIGKRAFYGCNSIDNISLPDDIKTINQSTFEGCTGLKQITLPNGLEKIEMDAFKGCGKLTTIKIPEKVIYLSGFNDCFGLTEITIPKNVEEIGKNAFSNCKIQNIIIPQSVKFIDFNAFYGCNNLSNITIPYGVKTMNSPFGGCDRLKTVTIDSKFGYRTNENNFYYNYNPSYKEVFGEQVENYIIGEHLTELGSNSFNDCINLKEITIPASVISIGDNAFSRCDNLVSVNINCKNIGNWFSNLESIKQINFGNGVEQLGENAFQGCVSLSSLIIPNNVKSIGSSAFSNCTSLGDIILPNSLTAIEDYLFSGCTNLNSVLIPDSIKRIGYNAFYSCDNLKKVIVPDISSWCTTDFKDNPLLYAQHLYRDKETEITNLVIPNTVSKISPRAFTYCKSFTSVMIPNSVTEIGNNTFEGCESLKKVIVPDIASWCGVKFVTDYNWGDQTCSNPLSIAHHLYSDENTEITDLVIPEGVDSINESVFFGASSLKSVSIPRSMKSIGGTAFYECSGLNKVIVPDIAAWCNIGFGDNPLKYAHHLYSDENTEIYDLAIPYGVKTINYQAFQGAEFLKSLSLSNSIETIAGSAFSECSSLQSVVFPNGLKKIGKGAFWECSSLETIVIPNSVIEIDEDAFGNCLSLYSVTSLINMPFKLDKKAFRYTGETYNTDVIYMAATLYVPRGKMAMYQLTEGWQKFLNVMETDTKFKLTYLLDGVVYKTYEIQATEVITPEAAPVKEGYIFSGWSEIPYLMPAHDVTITGSLTVDPDYIEGVEIVEKDEEEPKDYYTVDGRHHQTHQRGFNIIRMSDGTIRKVLMK